MLRVHAPSPRPVTVSIVIHKQWELVEPLLRQLQQWCAHEIEEVILTVNLPESAVHTDFLDLHVRRLDNSEPKGFGTNHNAAFKTCRSPWFLVLNPDIRLDGDILSRMVEHAADEAGLVTPRIREPGKEHVEPFRGLLTPLELVRRRRPGYLPPQEPAWVAGMFMLLRARAFAQVRGFDERYFMYCEDFDLCARLRLASWQLQVAADQQVLHDARRASNASLRPLAWHLASFAKLWTSPAFWRYAALLRRERGT